jgi:hypothetical protein
LLWLRLAVYAFQRRCVWISDNADAYWFGRVAFVGPGWIEFDVADDNPSTAVHRVVLPLDRVRVVRERNPHYERSLLESCLQGNGRGDEPGGPERSPV